MVHANLEFGLFFLLGIPYLDRFDVVLFQAGRSPVRLSREERDLFLEGKGLN